MMSQKGEEDIGGEVQDMTMDNEIQKMATDLSFQCQICAMRRTFTYYLLK